MRVLLGRGRLLVDTLLRTVPNCVLEAIPPVKQLDVFDPGLAAFARHHDWTGVREPLLRRREILAEVCRRLDFCEHAACLAPDQPRASPTPG